MGLATLEFDLERALPLDTPARRELKRRLEAHNRTYVRLCQQLAAAQEAGNEGRFHELMVELQELGSLDIGLLEQVDNEFTQQAWLLERS